MTEKKNNEEREILWYKHFFDLHKHLTTLAAGSLVLLAAVLKDLFSNPVNIKYVHLTFLALMITLATSLISMYLITFGQYDKSIPAKWRPRVLFLSGSASGFSIVSFFFAMIFFTTFFIKNYGLK